MLFNRVVMFDDDYVVVHERLARRRVDVTGSPQNGRDRVARAADELPECQLMITRPPRVMPHMRLNL